MAAVPPLSSAARAPCAAAAARWGPQTPPRGPPPPPAGAQKITPVRWHRVCKPSRRMKTMARLALAPLVLLPLAGCASRTAPAVAQAPADTFTGEVWTWDERENTVTLRQGSQTFRVKTTPEQMRGLQLHQIATIRGQVAPPAELPRTMTAAVPMTAVPRGPVDQQTVAGEGTAVDPNGRLSIDSEPRPLPLWAAAGASGRVGAGRP